MQYIRYFLSWIDSKNEIESFDTLLCSLLHLGRKRGWGRAVKEIIRQLAGLTAPWTQDLLWFSPTFLSFPPLFWTAKWSHLTNNKIGFWWCKELKLLGRSSTHRGIYPCDMHQRPSTLSCHCLRKAVLGMYKGLSCKTPRKADSLMLFRLDKQISFYHCPITQ